MVTHRDNRALHALVVCIILPEGDSTSKSLSRHIY
jgi:hypothetical protein